MHSSYTYRHVLNKPALMADPIATGETELTSPGLPAPSGETGETGLTGDNRAAGDM